MPVRNVEVTNFPTNRFGTGPRGGILQYMVKRLSALNGVDMSLDVSLLTSETMPDLADYMTIQDAAKKLRYHVESVRRMLRDKGLDGSNGKNLGFFSENQ